MKWEKEYLEKTRHDTPIHRAFLETREVDVFSMISYIRPYNYEHLKKYQMFNICMKSFIIGYCFAKQGSKALKGTIYLDMYRNNYIRSRGLGKEKQQKRNKLFDDFLNCYGGSLFKKGMDFYKDSV